MNESQKELLRKAITGTKRIIADLKSERATERAKLKKLEDVRAEIHVLRQPAKLNELQTLIVEQEINGLEWENKLHDSNEHFIEKSIEALDERIALREADLAELREGLRETNVFEFVDAAFIADLYLGKKPE